MSSVLYMGEYMDGNGTLDIGFRFLNRGPLDFL